MIQFDPTGERVGGLEHVDRVVRRIVLKRGLQDAVRLEPQFPRDDESLCLKRDPQPTVVRGACDVDETLFQRRFRQIRRHREFVGVGAAGVLRVIGRHHLLAVTEGVGRVEGAVIDVGGKDLLGLPHGERESFGIALAENGEVVLVVLDGLLRDDEPERVGAVDGAGDERLTSVVVGDPGAFRLLLSKAESGDTDDFLVSLSRLFFVEQELVLFRPLVVGFAVERIDTRPTNV